MDAESSSIAELRERYLRGESEPPAVLERALVRANSNAGRNVYLELDAEWSREEARRLRREDMDAQPLWGVPVSLKDCFDLAGFRTSCGSKFYRERNGVAKRDSMVAQRLRAAGAVIVGKTHLHQLAYGITGENAEFGDCAQPSHATRLTGGSSSGAAASVQEGSAWAAIGTDTGGSVRAPAALCGLAGYRSSISLQDSLWSGGAHLAESFDTVGWLYRDLADGPVLARVLFDLPATAATKLDGLKVGVPSADFLNDCEAGPMEALRIWMSVAGVRGEGNEFDARFWEDAMSVFAPIQASEAAVLHRGNFAHFEPVIAERLAWGASLSEREVSALRLRMSEFRGRMDELLARFDVLMLPCSPLPALPIGADHSQTRARILRYTAPISLAGLPVVTLPGSDGGVQLVGRMGSDAQLLALSVELGKVSAAAGIDATLHP